MDQSNNNQKPNNKLDFVREKVFKAFPRFQLLESNVLDKACCFSYAIPMDDDEYDCDNSIILCEAFDELEQEQQTQLQQQGQEQHLQHQHETTIVAIKNLKERTASRPKVENHVYLDAAYPSLADGMGERSAIYLKSPSFSADTATTYCKSYGSTSSVFSHQSFSTINWSDLEDESDVDELESHPPANFYRDVMVIRRVQSESGSELPYLLVPV